MSKMLFISEVFNVFITCRLCIVSLNAYYLTTDLWPTMNYIPYPGNITETTWYLHVMKNTYVRQ